MAIGSAARARPASTPQVAAQRKFLRFFPAGFRDETYEAWERGYKVRAHEDWAATLDRTTYRRLLASGAHAEIAARAIRIEARTNLLFSFEKMGLRDAVRSPGGARTFATALFDFLHGGGSLERRWQRWAEAVAALPRRQSRVATWPVLTVFGFVAQPDGHMFLKPTVTRVAARAYGFAFDYRRPPAWETYASLLDFADLVRRDLGALRPRDLIDVQSFMWVQGSDEYEE